MNNQYYTNCRELPMHNFNEIMITKDLKNLVKNGDYNVSDNVLKTLWADICNEYSILNESEEDTVKYRLYVDIMRLENSLKVANILLYIKDMDLNEDNIKAFEKIKKINKITDVELSISVFKDALALKRTSYKNQFETKKEKTDSKLLFEDVLANLRKDGYVLDRHTVTVGEWISIIKTYKK